MSRRFQLGESELNELYTEQGMNQREIAEQKGVHERTIGKLMQRLGIPVRKREQSKIEHACVNCGKVTTNPKFCSNTCAAIHNNKHFPKRQKQKRE